MRPNLLTVVVAWLIGPVLVGSAVHATEPMVTTQNLLKDPKFKTAYLSALGPKAKEKWLSTMTNSAPVSKVTLVGESFQVATPCKPHDCAEHNLLLLYAPVKGVVYGKLYEKGMTTLIGAPSAAISADLEKMWKKEFRQQ